MKITLMKKTGITYTLQGDYYLPNLTLPAEETKYIGIWGQRHKRYLQKYKRVTYTTLTWIKAMNSIHNRAMEIVYAKIIYA